MFFLKWIKSCAHMVLDVVSDFQKYVINGEEIPFHKKVPQVVISTTKSMGCA